MSMERCETSKKWHTLPDSPAPSKSIFISFLAIIRSRLSWFSISSFPRGMSGGDVGSERGELRTGFCLFVDGGRLNATHLGESRRGRKERKKALANPRPPTFSLQFYHIRMTNPGHCPFLAGFRPPFGSTLFVVFSSPPTPASPLSHRIFSLFTSLLRKQYAPVYELVSENF